MIQRLGRENLDEIEATIARYDIECDFERTGELQVAVAPWQFKGMAEQADRATRWATTSRYSAKSEVQARVHSPSYVGALFDHDGTALVDPARLVWGLERACCHSACRSSRTPRSNGSRTCTTRVRVHTPYGAVTAARVALGTNVFPSLSADPQVRRAVYDYAW